MKKTNLTILGLGLCLSFFAIPLKAQDEKPTKVTITITENDMVTTDTTFELKGSQDPEMITKIVTKLTGEDIHGKHEKVMIFESLDSAGHHVIRSKDHHVMVVSDEGDHEGEVKVFVSSLDPDEEGKTMNTIDLMVHAHEDMDKAGEDHDAEVIVIRKGDKDIKVIKKVRVKVEDDDDPSDEAEKDDIKK